MENIGIDNLIQKFAEQKGTGKERPGTACRAACIKKLDRMPSTQHRGGGETHRKGVQTVGACVLLQSAALAGFEEYMTALAPEGGKKSRAKAFRIPGLGKRDKEPDST